MPGSKPGALPLGDAPIRCDAHRVQQASTHRYVPARAAYSDRRGSGCQTLARPQSSQSCLLACLPNACFPCSMRCFSALVQVAAVPRLQRRRSLPLVVLAASTSTSLLTGSFRDVRCPWSCCVNLCRDDGRTPKGDVKAYGKPRTRQQLRPRYHPPPGGHAQTMVQPPGEPFRPASHSSGEHACVAKQARDRSARGRRCPP